MDVCIGVYVCAHALFVFSTRLSPGRGGHGAIALDRVCMCVSSLLPYASIGDRALDFRAERLVCVCDRARLGIPSSARARQQQQQPDRTKAGRGTVFVKRQAEGERKKKGR